MAITLPLTLNYMQNTHTLSMMKLKQTQLVIDNATGEVDRSDNSAGLDNKNSLVSIGLKYSLIKKTKSNKLHVVCLDRTYFIIEHTT